MQNIPKILVAPLDWGLGHSTRMIPIIAYLIKSNCEVTIAGSGLSLELLKSNFPELNFLEMPGYNIHYKGSSFVLNIAAQLPKFFLAITREKKWLQTQLAKDKYDLIISDNRYGLYDKKTFSVFCTHQVQIRSGMGKKIDELLLKWHLNKINRFHHCWIIDKEKTEQSIVPKQSHPSLMPQSYSYIGLLSQLSPKIKREDKEYILVLLSGPEPKRTELQDILIEQIKNLSQEFIMVCGTNNIPETEVNNLKILGLCTKEELNDLIADAKLVICRSGYSSIMDLALLRKKALLIPTPDQTEQIYISEVLNEQLLFYYNHQHQLQLKDDIEKAETYKGFTEMDLGVNEDFKIVVDKLLMELR